MTAATFFDFRNMARRRLPPFLFEYYDGGSFDEVTVARNQTDLKAVQLKQRVLCDVTPLDLSQTLFGETLGMPIALAPVGLGGLATRRGEVQAARAAAKAGIPLILSTASLCSLDEVVHATDVSLWFQLYMPKDHGFMRELLGRAWALGVRTLVLTVDISVTAPRYRDIRSGLTGSSPLGGKMRRGWQVLQHAKWMLDVGLMGRPHSLGNVVSLIGKRAALDDFFALMRDNFNIGLSWNDITLVRTAWPGNLVIKGIMEADDAREAIAHGANGIVVSNHGGRQLDGVPSTACALPVIASAVSEKTTIIVDGGVRSGLDVLRMLALGATTVLIGRAWVFALAANGSEGVTQLLTAIKHEMEVAMTLTGNRAVADVSSNSLW